MHSTPQRRDEPGLQITFNGTALETTRHDLRGHRKEWTDLDHPIWIRTAPDKEDIFDGGEEWFSYIFSFLT